MRKLVRKILPALVFLALVLVTLHVIFLNALRQSHSEGALMGEAELIHTFQLRNYSWHRIDVGDAHTSCGCTVVADLPKSIEPFQRLDIPIRIDLSGRSGKFQSKVSLSLPPFGLAEFEIVADVYPVLPAVIELGDVQKGAVIEKVFAADERVFNSSSEFSNDNMTVEARVVEGQPILSLAIHAPMESGDFAFSMGEGSASPTVNGRVLKEVQASVDTLSLGYIRLGAGEERSTTGEVAFVSTTGALIAWQQGSSVHSDKVSIREAPSEAGVTLAVTLETPQTGGLYKENLEFYFTVEGDPEMIRVPVELYAYVLEDIS